MFRLIIAVIILSRISAEDYYKGDTLIKKGVYAFYNYDFDEAVSILDNARNQFPDHPGVHLIWAASRWVRAQAYEPIEETYLILQDDLDEIVPIYDNLVKKYVNDYNYGLYQGSTIGLYARLSLGKKQWLKTLYHAHKGFRIINDVYKNSPQIIDSQLPIGIVEYYGGISQSIFRWAIKLYDLQPSTESGLQRISLSADEGHWSWIEAKSILSNLYLWVEDEPILALEHTQDLVKQFPNNFYFNLLHLESLIRTNNIELSHDLLKEMEININNLTDRQIDWYLPYLLYEKALFTFYQKEFSTALELVTRTITNYTAELDIILGNAYLLQGMIYDKINLRGKAKASYYHCINLDNFSSSIEKAELYLKQPFYKIQ